MADRFDVAQALAGASGERAQVWEFAKEFAASWATPLSLGDGFVPAEVCRAEERLGRRVPVALHEAYALFGRRSDLVAHHNPLLPPDELLLDPSGQLLVFRSENQGCAGWCVPLDQLSADDPPVVFFSDYLPDLVWEPFMPSLSLACAETILSETVMGRRYGPTGRDCVATPEVLSGVEDQFEPVGLPGYPAWHSPGEPPIRWFSAAGKLLCLEPGNSGQDLVVVGRTEGDLLEVLQAIPGEWSDPADTAGRAEPEEQHDLVLPF
ncbi:SMI1/KNR4 family protein [Streptomyces sp. BF23-19]|uniref:SMI1/KNR4 family protein n=1 Tax=Streptomyces TaxID=1883 RepID=UPI0034E3F959|nr:SMI1/KNR4 family protein [Streptomyces virginiae]